MRGKMMRAWWAFAAAFAAVVLMAGCGQYRPGEPFQDPREDYWNQSTPVAAVQKLLMSMEWKERDPDKGRDFDAFVEVAAPALFPESPIDSKVMEELRERWNSRNWEVEFKELKFETSPPEADDPGWEGDEASVRIVDGQVRYYGKEMFDTNEWKVESFKDKPGEFVLRKLDGRWRVMGARVIGDGDSWSVE